MNKRVSKKKRNCSFKKDNNNINIALKSESIYLGLTKKEYEDY